MKNKFEMEKKTILYRILGTILFLVNLFFAYQTINEFVKVAIRKDILFYPFGCDCDVPYYFDSAQLYSNIMLFQGIVFSILALLSLISIFKPKFKFSAIIIIATIILFIAVFANRQIH